MKLNTLNHTLESAPTRDWRRRPLTRVAVCLISWWTCGVSYAVDFPALPLQTGVTQPAPNVIFILDDSLSMTSVSGGYLDTGLTWSNENPDMPSSEEGAPYTKNPLSYNPKTEYKPWATANNTDTSLVRLGNASYTAALSSDQWADTDLNDDVEDLSADTETFYVPKSAATLTDQRTYYRYEILTGGYKTARAEWVNTASPATTYNMLNGPVWTGLTGDENYWGSTVNKTANGLGNTGAAPLGNPNFRYQVPADGSVSRITITTSGATGTNHNANLYVRYGQNPTTGNYAARANTTGTSNETITIDVPTAGQWLYIGVYNAASGTGDRTFSNLTLTVRYSTDPTQAMLGCDTSGAGTYGWKNCADVSSGDTTYGVRALAAEKQNYANWYQYHRTRMKTAKAGGSEAFATLDENYRVGLMGLYPSSSDSKRQILGGTMPNIIPVDSNGGLFVGANRQNWFDHLHGMAGKSSTPLRQALKAAGDYYATAKAYKSTVNSETTYLACRQNFTILTTDGYWNNFANKDQWGNVTSYDDPDSNYTSISGDEEAGSTITGPNGQSYKYERAAPYWYNVAAAADDSSLADVAMHYWKTDLRTSDVSGYPGSADNRVPFSTANPAFWQHMVTFGVGLGVSGQLTAAQTVHAVAGTGTEANGGYWPKPVHATGATENKQNVDDLRHAAVNARGSYINANDSTQFANGIKDALSRIGERRGSASNVLANSTSISTESFVYQATYTAGSWRGELLAYPISSAGLGAPQWRASENIRAWGSRQIFTEGGTFPTSAQSTALATPATTLGVTAAELANYLKGDASKEKRNAGVLRDRTQRNTAGTVISALLGDIVDSSPFYVADNQTVFVGANGGMLHAIDATGTIAAADKSSGGGTERFTYIPGGVAMSTLAELADPLYGTNSTKPHRFFVDGPIVVSSRARTPGKNYLVGGLGRGGRGVYGLNVTSPSTFSATDVLWDATGSDAPDDMGNVIAEPLISKLNSGVTAAVVANGPNSVSGNATLFILDLDTGAEIAKLGTDTEDNGLSAPRAVDSNADGLVDFFFAGDLLGNLWRFNVSDADQDNWEVEKVFTAETGGGGAQAITSAPGVARDTTTGDVWVFFGTGRYITSEDQANTDTQTYYGIRVGATGAEYAALDRTMLQSRDISVVDATTGRRAFEAAAASVDEDLYGWYLDLDNPSGTGERVISAPLLYDNILIFSSIVPPSSSTVNSCDAGGSGYVNALDAFTGTSLTVPFFDLAVPMIGTVPVGSVPISAGMPTAPIIIGDQLVVGDSSGGTPTSEDVSAPGGSSTKRVSWRELLQ